MAEQFRRMERSANLAVALDHRVDVAVRHLVLLEGPTKQALLDISKLATFAGRAERTS